MKPKLQTTMIRKCFDSDTETIYEIINDAAIAYKGQIPEDRWKEPYMPMDELLKEIEEGVGFYCYEENNEILGVMGIQDVKDVKLIRHAYVRTKKRKGGIGTQLLHFLTEKQDKPILIGTWKDATWAIDFYLKNGFRMVSEEEKNILLKKYWNIPERQVETSIVLSNQR
ncbi:GNAT family N-acetyltransferase [Prevotella sp. 10(H)]|uniref:GNAT family N-acetyltransferase n=1 Tax=Prevotella sp. 10(H) TaxID=1158294 RepID=UPI0018CC49D5|nr:GNAT family N-acetyltransferase [Prevotella sp. 10(H)]